MPDDPQVGGTPADPPSDQGGTPGQTPPADPPAGGTPPAGPASATQRRDADDRAELRSALDSERQERKRLEAETKRLQAAIDSQADAGKPEVERERARADREATRANEAEARLAQKEVEALAHQVAGEAGIPHLWEWLKGDDLRSLRANAQKLRESMGHQGGALDGGARGIGVPQEPTSMDEMIRAGARRR